MIRRLLLAGLLSLSVSATTSLLAQGTGASPSGSNTPSGASKSSTSTSTGASTGSQNGNQSATGGTSTTTGASTTTGGTTSGRGTTSTGQSRGDNMGKMDAKRFVMQAAQDGMAEVQLGQLARSKGTSDAVKAFGKMMVEDHTRANDELQAFSAAKKLQMPKDIGSEHKQTMARLKKLTGTSFDKAYINTMVKEHEKAVKQFEQASTMLEDAELKAWAARTLPTLQAHLKHAQSLQGGTKSGSQSKATQSGGSASGSATVGVSTSGGTTKAGASVGTGGSK